MKTSQKRAIYYSIREKKIEKIKKLGLWDEYTKQMKRRHNLDAFMKRKGVSL